MTPTILALLLAAGLPVPPQASQLPPWYHWLFEAFRPAGGGSGTVLTVTGISPLALVNAMAAPIHSLTQYGKCVQNGTPTPSAPVDILCNNGVLRYGAMGSNLYDPSTAVFEVGYYYAPTAEGAQTTAANNFIYHSYIPVEAGAAYVFYGRQKDTNRISQYNRIHWYDAEKSYISTNTYTAGVVGRGVAPENAVYARLSCNPQGASTAISEETVLGYNWTFCKGTAEVTPFVPFVGGVKPVGTPEVLTVGGQNLVDLTAVTNGYYYSPSGVYTALAVARLTDYIPIKGGRKYTVYVQAKQIGTSANVRCNLFDSAQVWKSQSTFSVTAGAANVGVVTPTEDGFLRVSANYTGTGAQADWSVLQIVQGEYTLATMPPYQPYHAPQTVTDIPMLLSVGDVKDDLELISGNADRAITVFRVSPDLNWALATGTGYKQFYTSDTQGQLKKSESCMSNIAPYGCTASNRASYQFGCYTGGTGNLCFQMIGEASISTVDAWKNFLRVNGVYVVAAKATATTEQTTPHALHSYNGTTIVTAQTNVDPVELRAEYVAEAT